jgi:hypothetical protein
VHTSYEREPRFSIDYIREIDLLHSINISTPLPPNSLLRAFLTQMLSIRSTTMCFHHTVHAVISTASPAHALHIFGHLLSAAPGKVGAEGGIKDASNEGIPFYLVFQPARVLCGYPMTET